MLNNIISNTKSHFYLFSAVIQLSIYLQSGLLVKKVTETQFIYYTSAVNTIWKPISTAEHTDKILKYWLNSVEHYVINTIVTVSMSQLHFSR